MIQCLSIYIKSRNCFYSINFIYSFIFYLYIIIDPAADKENAEQKGRSV